MLQVGKAPPLHSQGSLPSLSVVLGRQDTEAVASKGPDTAAARGQEGRPTHRMGVPGPGPRPSGSRHGPPGAGPAGPDTGQKGLEAQLPQNQAQPAFRCGLQHATLGTGLPPDRTLCDTQQGPQTHDQQHLLLPFGLSCSSSPRTLPLISGSEGKGDAERGHQCERHRDGSLLHTPQPGPGQTCTEGRALDPNQTWGPAVQRPTLYSLSHTSQDQQHLFQNRHGSLSPHPSRPLRCQRQRAIRHVEGRRHVEGETPGGGGDAVGKKGALSSTLPVKHTTQMAEWGPPACSPGPRAVLPADRPAATVEPTYPTAQAI